MEKNGNQINNRQVDQSFTVQSTGLQEYIKFFSTAPAFVKVHLYQNHIIQIQYCPIPKIYLYLPPILRSFWLDVGRSVRRSYRHDGRPCKDACRHPDWIILKPSYTLAEWIVHLSRLDDVRMIHTVVWTSSCDITTLSRMFRSTSVSDSSLRWNRALFNILKIFFRKLLSVHTEIAVWVFFLASDIYAEKASVL